MKEDYVLLEIDKTQIGYPLSSLEISFIKSFLKSKGFEWKELRRLPKETVKALMTEACIYASVRLAEIETRNTLLRELHGTP